MKPSQRKVEQAHDMLTNQKRRKSAKPAAYNAASTNESTSLFTAPSSERSPERGAFIKQLFCDEAAEHLKRISLALAALESAAGPGAVFEAALVDELFRHVHALKGSAGSVAAHDVEAKAHQFETVCAELRAGETQLTQGLWDALESDVRNIRAQIQGLRQGPDLSAAGQRRAPGGQQHWPDGQAEPKHAKRHAPPLNPSPAQGHRLRPQPQTPTASRIDNLLTERAQTIPFGWVAMRLQTTARELSQNTGKPAVLLCFGEDQHVDRSLVDIITNPLIQLVRNAFVHGLEDKDVRLRTGKPPWPYRSRHSRRV